MKTMKKILFAAGLAVIIAGCSDMNTDSSRADIQFRLTDAPGEFQEVNIDIVAVNVIVNDSMIELGTNQGIYNLLDFVNGRDTLIVDEDIPSGYISQIRLVLGENNTVMVDSVVYALKTPSAQQSGLKLQVHEELVGGESYAYVIDFMVDKSVHQTGNGKYMLKPVIRVFTEAITGAISGIAQPAEARPVITAMSDVDTVSTYADTVSGTFMIRGLAEGNYKLEFIPLDAYQDTVLTDITVLPGQVIEVDTMFIQQ
jgi:hypothetical protein